MAGNVSEWTDDWYLDNHEDDADKACCIPANPRAGSPELRPRTDSVPDPSQGQRAGRFSALTTTASGTRPARDARRWSIPE